jgi:hypothetical protein
MREIRLDISARVKILSELLDDLLAILLFPQVPIISKSDAPRAFWTGRLVSVVIRKGKDIRRTTGATAGRKPSRLGGGKIKVNLGTLVNMAGCDSIGFEGRQWWVESDIAEAVAALC